jgi:hypothetical protein
LIQFHSRKRCEAQEKLVCGGDINWEISISIVLLDQDGRSSWSGSNHDLRAAHKRRKKCCLEYTGCTWRSEQRLGFAFCDQGSLLPTLNQPFKSQFVNPRGQPNVAGDRADVDDGRHEESDKQRDGVTEKRVFTELPKPQTQEVKRHEGCARDEKPKQYPLDRSVRTNQVRERGEKKEEAKGCRTCPNRESASRHGRKQRDYPNDGSINPKSPLLRR